MAETTVKFWNSIVSRFALFFTGLIVFSILLSGYLVYRKASRVITDYSQERIRYSSELAERSFYTMLAEVSNDVAVIASSPSLANYINNPSPKNESELNHLFRVTLEYKPPYFQLRLIGVEDNGREIIRFDKTETIGYNRVNKEIKQYTGQDLQQKGDRDYFKEGIQMKEGELYFSRISLNEEYGGVDDEYVPTLRAASPVYDGDGQLFGLVVINVDLRRLYKTFEQVSAAGPQLYLIDEQGQYLYSPDAARQFGVQLGHGYSFLTDFDVPVDSLFRTSGTLSLNDRDHDVYLSFVKEFSYFKGLRKVYLVTALEENALLRSARIVRTESIQTLLWVCLFSLLLSYFFTRLLSRRINRITDAISRYGGTDQDIRLPEKRNDEIGVLARTFTKMKAKIDQQMTALNVALGKEKEARKQRDEFLQNMSHEMRTPLNAILGLTQLLYKNDPPASQKPIIHALERSANNLAGLMYDVLDHQKLVEGKVTIQPAPANINDLLQDVYSSYQFEAVNKNLSFNLRVDDVLKQNMFMTDALRLSQVVTNLVVNAIKYTEKGSVEITAAVMQEDDHWLHVRVIDTGVGILPENIEKINDRFFQERAELSGRYGGYGLGLSIVKQIVALFGGTLEAQSTKGRGSEFHVRIPVIPVKASTPVEVKITQSLPLLKNTYRVLHIEDDLSTLELIQYGFAGSTIQLVQLSQLDEIEAFLNENTPALVISDCMLGDKMLNDTLRHWMDTGRITCPVVLVSALEPTVMKEVSARYFQKPFELSSLVNLVYVLLGAGEYTAPDLSNLYSSYDGHVARVSKVLKLLEDEFGTYIKRVEKAVDTGDQKEWDAIRHKVIAHINNLRLTGLAQSMPLRVEDAKHDDILIRMVNIMRYYMACFREERRINSAD